MRSMAGAGGKGEGKVEIWSKKASLRCPGRRFQKKKKGRGAEQCTTGRLGNIRIRWELSGFMEGLLGDAEFDTWRFFFVGPSS